MKILIYGINFSPELTGTGKYNGEMAEWFAENGHEVEVITTYPYYPEWKISKAYKNNQWIVEKSQNLTIKRCPTYIPKKVTSVSRIFHELSFLFSSLRFWIPSYFTKYDVIISVAPPMLMGIYPAIYGFFRKKTITVYHIQDLQIDVAKELRMIKNKLVLLALENVERWILSRTKVISSISKGMRDKILFKGHNIEKKYVMLPNWVDTDFIKPLTPSISLMNRLSFTKEDFIILYSGNLGEKQGLELILDVAKEVLYIKDIKFLICGSGAVKEKLIAMKVQSGLHNVFFQELLPYDELPQLMSIGKIHLVIQKKGAGDLVMPSKLTTILASGGLAIITAEPETSLFNIVKDDNIAVCISGENSQILKEAILSIYDNQENYDAIKANALQYALRYLNKNAVLTDFENCLQTKKE